MNIWHTVTLSAALLSLTAACGKKAEAPPPTAPPAATTPAPEADTAAAAAPDTAPAAAPEADTAEAPAPSVDAGIAATPPSGLGELPDRFVPVFTRFFGLGGPDRSYRVLEVSIASNAAKVFAEERVGAGAECRLGWAWLDTMDKEGEDAGVTDVEVTRFGGDCCTDEPCARPIAGAFVHFLTAIHAKDWAKLAAFVPPGATVAYTLTSGPEGASKRSWGHAQLATGEIDVPGCYGTEMVPTCDEAAGEDGGFTCRCDAGGYHVSYRFKVGEGDNALPVLVSVDDDQH